jgi:hypothetical protein
LIGSGLVEDWGEIGYGVGRRVNGVKRGIGICILFCFSLKSFAGFALAAIKT